MAVSLREIAHLLASLIVLTIAFTYPSLNPERLAIVAFGVGIGFIFHELAHKFTAQRYGYFADFEASTTGLVLAIGLSLMTAGNFVFAAPGAVMIRGKRVFYASLEDRYIDALKTGREMAYISISGPVMNLVLSLFFLLSLSFVTPFGLEYKILGTGAFINVFLALFNMIPVGPLDGRKVWRYSRVLWGMVGVPVVALFLLL